MMVSSNSKESSHHCPILDLITQLITMYVPSILCADLLAVF